IAHGDLYLWAGLSLILLVIVGLVISRDWEANSLALLIWLLPLGLVLGLGFRSGLFEVRYLMVGLPGLALLAGVGIARLARIHAAAVMLVALPLIPAASALSAQYYDPSLARDDYRDLVAAIS